MSDRSEALRGRVMKSAYWMVLNSGVVRALSFATQIVLAIILAKEDFGVYAVAVSLSALLTNFRGGGMYQWMIHGGKAHVKEREGTTFWVSLTFNVILGLAMVALAGPAGAFYGDPNVAYVMVIAGASFPLLTFGSHSKALLAMDLRMRDVTRIEIIATVVRSALMVIFALAGLGPLSFVLPLPVSHVIEGVLGIRSTPGRSWRPQSPVRTWPNLLWHNRWIMAGTIVITIGLQADNLILGRLTSLAVLGVYFFAYQLTYMSATIVTNNARRILVPAFVAVESSRRSDAALNAARTGTLLGAPLLLLLGVMIAPLESLFWNGKWEAAVYPVIILSAGLPLQMLTIVTQSTLESSRRYRLWTSVNAMRACFTVAGAFIAAQLTDSNVTIICIVMASAFAVANLLQIWIAFRQFGVSAVRVLKSTAIGVLLAPVLEVTVALAFKAMDLPVVVSLFAGPIVFGGVYVLIAWILVPKSLKESLNVARLRV